MFSFQKNYFAVALLLFFIEVLIAAFVHDRFVRPYAGDFLVVIFLYCFFRSFLKTPYPNVALAVLLFAYLVEASQYFHLLRHLGWQRSGLAILILGNGFDRNDLLAYTLGILLVLAIEKIREKTVLTRQ